MLSVKVFGKRHNLFKRSGFGHPRNVLLFISSKRDIFETEQTQLEFKIQAVNKWSIEVDSPIFQFEEVLLMQLSISRSEVTL